MMMMMQKKGDSLDRPEEGPSRPPAGPAGQTTPDGPSGAPSPERPARPAGAPAAKEAPPSAPPPDACLGAPGRLRAAAPSPSVGAPTERDDERPTQRDDTLKEGDAALKEGDAALKEGDAALKEGDAALKEGDAAPEAGVGAPSVGPKEEATEILSDDALEEALAAHLAGLGHAIDSLPDEELKMDLMVHLRVASTVLNGLVFKQRVSLPKAKEREIAALDLPAQHLVFLKDIMLDVGQGYAHIAFDCLEIIDKEIERAASPQDHH